MSRRRLTIRLCIGLMSVAGLTLTAAACSDDTKDSTSSAVSAAGSDVKNAATKVLDNATEMAIRNVATQQGEEQFTNAGHPLDDKGLTCKANVADGVSKVSVSCTGTTKDSKPAALDGTTTEIPGASVVELEGDFVGMVGGAEVFATKKLGG